MANAVELEQLLKTMERNAWNMQSSIEDWKAVVEDLLEEYDFDEEMEERMRQAVEKMDTTSTSMAFNIQTLMRHLSQYEDTNSAS